MRLLVILMVALFSNSVLAEAKTDYHPWRAVPPTLMKALADADAYVDTHQGYDVYAGVLACYSTPKVSAEESCQINDINSNVLDPEVLANGQQAYDNQALKNLMDISEPGIVGLAYGASIQVRFLLARCFNPVGTADMDDLPYCTVETHYEETN